MKKYVLLFIMVADAFFSGCFAQHSDKFLVNTKTENLRMLSDRMAKNDFVIISYYVEEKINMKFGATTTTYTVPSLDMVNTNDLGEANKRTIIPKYARVKAVGLHDMLPKVSFVLQKNIPVKIDVVVFNERRTSININVLRTYERVLESGYCTEEMLKRVADCRYFEGELDVAAKWYSELYFMTSDLAPEFYYRYAESLKSIGQIEKAKEMMAIYESRN